MVVDVILFYNENTKYSLNPLISVLDKIKDTRVLVVDKLGELLKTAYLSSISGDRCIVGFSLMTTMIIDENFLVDLKNTIRKLRDIGCITICGGPHASGDPLGTLSYFKCDYVFVGEAEESLREFVEKTRDRLDPRDVGGIAYLEDEKFVFTGRRGFIDLDKYDPFPYWRGIMGPIEITRGCPYGCFYCQVSYCHGFQYRHRKIENIVFYVEKLLEIGGRDIRFISPDGLAYGLSRKETTPNIEALGELLSSIKNTVERYKGRVFLGTFPSEVRPEHVIDESLRLLRSSVSNRSIIIGAQSGSERILKMINRQHSVEDVLNAAMMAINHGFIPDIDLILGFPGETLEDMMLTVKLAKQITRLGGRIHLHYYLPLPGTPLGLKPPTPIPDAVKKELHRIIGSGRGYGHWTRQEEYSRMIIRLHEMNIIMPKRRS